MLLMPDGSAAATTRSGPPATGTTIRLCPTPVASSCANAIDRASGEIDGISLGRVLTRRGSPAARPVLGSSGCSHTCCTERVSPPRVNTRASRDGDTARSHAAPVKTLAFNTTYAFANNLSLNFSATNLTNVRRAYYRYSEEEQAKLDVIGRQYYLNLKYKF